jgi:hypothetical protein
MLNEKMFAILKRQNELTAKLADGTATDDEKAELDKLGKTITALTDADKVDVGKTRLETMTVADFQKHVESEQAALDANLDPARLALLKRNIDNVKAQGKTSADDHVAVEVAVQASAEDRIATVEAKLDELLETVKASFDRRTSTGVNDGGDAGDPPAGDGGDAGGDDGGDGSDVGKGDDKPVTTALAMEAIESVIECFNSIKAKVQEGTLTSDELYKMWPGWEVREMIEGAVGVLAKAEELSKLVEEVKPELEKIATAKADDDDDAGKADPPEKCPKCGALMMGKMTCPSCGHVIEDKGDDDDDDGKGDDDDEGNDDGKGDDDKGSTAKGDWLSGVDISPNSGSDTDDYRAIRKGR